jgi:hypothetical protein
MNRSDLFAAINTKPVWCFDGPKKARAGIPTRASNSATFLGNVQGLSTDRPLPLHRHLLPNCCGHVRPSSPSLNAPTRACRTIRLRCDTQPRPLRWGCGIWFLQGTVFLLPVSSSFSLPCRYFRTALHPELVIFHHAGGFVGGLMSVGSGGISSHRNRLELNGKTFRKDSFMISTQCFKIPPLLAPFVLLLEFVWVHADHISSLNSDQEVKCFNILDQFVFEAD